MTNNWINQRFLLRRSPHQNKLQMFAIQLESVWNFAFKEFSQLVSVLLVLIEARQVLTAFQPLREMFVLRDVVAASLERGKNFKRAEISLKVESIALICVTFAKIVKSAKVTCSPANHKLFSTKESSIVIDSKILSMFPCGMVVASSKKTERLKVGLELNCDRCHDSKCINLQPQRSFVRTQLLRQSKAVGRPAHASWDLTGTSRFPACASSPDRS